MSDDGMPTEPVGGDDVEQGEPSEDDSATPGAARKRNMALGAVVLVALLIVAVVAALFWPSDASGYTDDVEANFMAACTADGGDGVEPVCGCLYDEIVETIPYDRFEEVNDALETERAADPSAPIQLPADFDEIRAACVDREGTTATTTSTTATPDSTTTAPPQTATTAAAAPATTAAPAPPPPAASPAPPAVAPPPPRNPSPAPASPPAPGGNGGLAP